MKTKELDNKSEIYYLISMLSTEVTLKQLVIIKMILNLLDKLK